MKQAVKDYTYNKVTGVITLTNLVIERNQLLIIVNATRNVFYYNFADSSTTLQSFSAGTSTSITLAESIINSATLHNNTDKLLIYYEDQSSTSVPVLAFDVENYGDVLPQWFTGMDKIGVNARLVQLHPEFGDYQLVTSSNPVPISGAVNASNLPLIGYDESVESGMVVPVKISGYGQPDVPISGTVTVSGTVTATADGLGEKSDASATTDSGTFSVIALIKRGLANWTALLAKIPALVSGRIPVDGSGVTQPVSGPLTDAQLRATALPVSGTFWQATQPVSGNVTALPRNGTITNVSSTITTGGTSQQVVASNSSRKYFAIQNISDTAMYLGVGYTPTTTTGILLSASGGGFVFESSFIPTSAINILCATTGKAFVALEG